jgi:hypothetical protein
MPSSNISDVRLIGQDDPGFRAFVARERAARAALSIENSTLESHKASHPQEAPQNSGQKSNGSVGRLVESAIRQWLGCRIKLEYNTILTWRERANSERRRHYAELDFLHRVDSDTVAVFEIKFLTDEWMLVLKGIDQLDRAERLLQHLPSSRNVLKRLVYVGDGSLQIPALPVIDPSDMQTPAGVVWVDAGTVELVSANRGTALPEGWRDRPHRALLPWLHPQTSARPSQAPSRRVA